MLLQVPIVRLLLLLVGLAAMLRRFGIFLLSLYETAILYIIVVIIAQLYVCFKGLIMTNLLIIIMIII